MTDGADLEIGVPRGLAEEVGGLGLGFGEDGLEVGAGMGGLDFGEFLLLELHLVEEAGLGVVAVGDFGEDGVDGQSFESFDGFGLVADEGVLPEGSGVCIRWSDTPSVDGGFDLRSGAGFDGLGLLGFEFGDACRELGKFGLDGLSGGLVGGFD